MKGRTAASDEPTPSSHPNVSARSWNTYYVTPNAAAVARVLKTHDRHVRRLVKEYAWYLEDRRRARDAEQLERESPGETRVQGTGSKPPSRTIFRRLDQLTHSEKDGVALRRSRPSSSWPRTFILPTGAVPGDIDAPLGIIHAELVGKLSELANQAGHGEEAGDA